MKFNYKHKAAIGFSTLVLGFGGLIAHDAYVSYPTYDRVQEINHTLRDELIGTQIVELSYENAQKYRALWNERNELVQSPLYEQEREKDNQRTGGLLALALGGMLYGYYHHSKNDRKRMLERIVEHGNKTKTSETPTDE